MRLNCLICGEILITKSKPSNMRHENKQSRELAFSSYLHCKKCGASIVAIVNMKVARQPFTEKKTAVQEI